jgi:hypothetical protein
LAGGAGFCFVLFKLLGILWGGVPILLVAIFSLALAFYKPNNKPFINMVEAGTKYLIQDKLYIWKKSIRKLEDKQAVDLKNKMSFDRGAKLTGSKLKDLAWSLDVLDLQKHQEHQS